MSSPERAVLRVATYNVYLGADLSLLFGGPALVDAAREVLRQLDLTDFRRRAEAVAAVVAEADIDVLGLQELAVWSRDGEPVVDFRECLLDALARIGAVYDVHALAPSFRGSARLPADVVGTPAETAVVGHNALLVRRRTGLAVTRARTGTFGEALTIDTAVGAVAVERSWGLVDVNAEGMQVRVVNTHGEAYDAHVRGAQRDELLRAVEWDGPTVVVGDFNETPDRVGMPSAYADAWLASGGAPEGGLTFGQAPDLRNVEDCSSKRIDYVFVSDATVVRCRVVGNRPRDRGPDGWPSDHACVIADIRLP